MSSWPEEITQVLRTLPDKPGCYIMRDRQGRIIYVGKALSLRRRVQSYFRAATLRRAAPRLAGLVRSVARLEYIVTRSEAEALLTESRLIKEYKPHYNVALRDDKRFPMLVANPREPWPRLTLGRIKREDGRLYFGPYTSSIAARVLLDFTEKRFGLRKCAPREPDAATYRHCLNDIIRFCAAPCIGRVDAAAYRARFEEACAFLRGERPDQFAAIETAMREAADALDFERAAAWRDTLALFKTNLRRRLRVAPTPVTQREQARAGVAALQTALALPTPPHIIEGYDISTHFGVHSVGSLVCVVDGRPFRQRYRRFRIRTVAGMDDPAMLAEVLRRRFAPSDGEAPMPAPDLLVVDGGLTQLRAARAALRELGYGHVPVAGLAKQFEEIHWADPGAPLRLDRADPALHVLQRLRDEAHRFALTYHRHLRSRRLSESALDEIEGVGPQRKATLLRHFGSVHRLARATSAAIAAVPGIGPALAETIHTILSPPAPPVQPPPDAPD